MCKLLITGELDKFVDRLDKTKVRGNNDGLLKITYINICGLCFDDGDITRLVARDVPDRLYNRPVIQSTHCNAGQEWREQEKVSRANNHLPKIVG